MTKFVKFFALLAFYGIFALLIAYGIMLNGFVGWFLVVVGTASIVILAVWKDLRNIFHGVIGIASAIIGLVLRSIDPYIAFGLGAYWVSVKVLQFIFGNAMTYLWSHPKTWIFHLPLGDIPILAVIIIIAIIMTAVRISKISFPSFLDELKREWKHLFPERA